MLVQEYRIISEEGISRDGFFVDRFVIGLLIGFTIGLAVMAFVMWCELSIKQNNIDKIYKQNYIIPKAKTLGTYIQMPDGKLYKRQ